MTTWNPADKSASITLSNGNLTATSAIGGNMGVRADTGRSGSKVYFENLYVAATGGGSSICGIALASADLPTWASNGSGGIAVFDSGPVFRNSVSTGINVGIATTGQSHCFAIDMIAKLLWVRVDAGNWNGSSSNNPATGVGGIDISAIFTTTLAAFACYGTASGSKSATANFGATAFAQAVPSGFAAWDSVTNAVSTQIGIETWVSEPTSMQSSQIGAEAWTTVVYAPTFMHSSQIGVEVWMPVVKSTPDFNMPMLGM
jgi:hypothetical protein